MADELGGGSVWPRRLGRFALYAALAAVLALVIAGPGHRFGIVGVMPGIRLAMAGGALALVAVILGIIAVIGILRVPGQPALGSAVVAVVIGAAISLQLYGWFAQARSVPAIHDISTDLEDPPAFSAIAPLRAGAPNPAAWAGPENAEQQRRAYPDLDSLVVDAPPAEVVRRAAEIARAFGWEVVAAEPDAGRLEAVDTTFWFGFRDDVVLRARSVAQGTEVDVRSKSRVGRSDLGTNAARIREFLAALEESLATSG
ncbi:DUF1499 domain-containing protein [Lentisalinibacter salinarum]|uniref:DUF1499 domain-containing protein n=1 Tax=Lentisalinibacter salinarum TaxID=2992239 RepID=UPI003870D852